MVSEVCRMVDGDCEVSGNLDELLYWVHCLVERVVVSEENKTQGVF